MLEGGCTWCHSFHPSSSSSSSSSEVQYSAEVSDQGANGFCWEIPKAWQVIFIAGVITAPKL